MKRINFLLHNHGPLVHAGPALEPQVTYFWSTLAALGFDVSASNDQLARDAVNVYFEYFLDERLLFKLNAFRNNYGTRVGIVATELIVDGDIPYMRDGILQVDPAARREATTDESVQASRLRVKNLLTHAPDFDFIWSLLPRTQALMRGLNPNAFLFPVGYLKPTRPVAAVPKDIDVLLFGTFTPHRATVVEALRAAKLNVHCVGRNTPAGFVPQFILDSLIDRAKIVLNLALSDDGDGADPKFASCFRIAGALSRGALIVSEAIPQDNPYASFMVSCTIAELPQRCADLVTDGRFGELAVQNFAAFKAAMAAEAVAASAVEILRSF